MDNFTAREIGKKYNHTVAQIKLKHNGKLLIVYFDNFTISDDGENICNVHQLTYP